MNCQRILGLINVLAVALLAGCSTAPTATATATGERAVAQVVLSFFAAVNAYEWEEARRWFTDEYASSKGPGWELSIRLLRAHETRLELVSVGEPKVTGNSASVKVTTHNPVAKVTMDREFHLTREESSWKISAIREY